MFKSWGKIQITAPTKAHATKRGESKAWFLSIRITGCPGCNPLSIKFSAIRAATDFMRSQMNTSLSSSGIWEILKKQVVESCFLDNHWETSYLHHVIRILTHKLENCFTNAHVSIQIWVIWPIPHLTLRIKWHTSLILISSSLKIKQRTSNSYDLRPISVDFQKKTNSNLVI